MTAAVSNTCSQSVAILYPEIGVAGKTASAQIVFAYNDGKQFAFAVAVVRRINFAAKLPHPFVADVQLLAYLLFIFACLQQLQAIVLALR